jgi:hypothetical protein
MSFYGLKKMSSEHAEVRSLVGYLENMLMVMPLPLGAQAVGNSLQCASGSSCTGQNTGWQSGELPRRAEISSNRELFLRVERHEQ